mmetsp:Transcript_31991/g.76725  ORF Transcript_31991/g.76725 Transcript_31991/m.76725 type:complete len:245 (-) Transcript_31991:158-892(-)
MLANEKPEPKMCTWGCKERNFAPSIRKADRQALLGVVPCNGILADGPKLHMHARDSGDCKYGAGHKFTRWHRLDEPLDVVHPPLHPVTLMVNIAASSSNLTLQNRIRHVLEELVGGVRARSGVLLGFDANIVGRHDVGPPQLVLHAITLAELDPLVPIQRARLVLIDGPHVSGNERVVSIHPRHCLNELPHGDCTGVVGVNLLENLLDILQEHSISSVGVLEVLVPPQAAGGAASPQSSLCGRF